MQGRANPPDEGREREQRGRGAASEIQDTDRLTAGLQGSAALEGRALHRPVARAQEPPQKIYAPTI